VVVSSSNSSCGGVIKRLHFSTDDESSDFSPFKKVKVKTTSRTQRKPTLLKTSEVTPSPKPVKPKKNALPKVTVGTISAESTEDKKTNVPEKRHLKGKRNSTSHRGDAFPSQVRNFLASLSGNQT
ncbi:unnamed protein product, partial [Timema podura]|nr:unnamed protein product [Timema podura]